MEITHTTRKIRVTPRKLRLVIDQLRHQPASTALSTLPLVNRGAAKHVYKSLKAAIHAAEDANLTPESLVIQRIYCDEGGALKRLVMHSRGRSSMIMKKYSHLSIVLTGEERTSKSKARRTRQSKTEEAATETAEVAAASESTGDKE